MLTVELSSSTVIVLEGVVAGDGTDAAAGRKAGVEDSCDEMPEDSWWLTGPEGE